MPILEMFRVRIFWVVVDLGLTPDLEDSKASFLNHSEPYWTDTSAVSVFQGKQSQRELCSYKGKAHREDRKKMSSHIQTHTYAHILGVNFTGRIEKNIIAHTTHTHTP